jgi:chemotaxis protein histidine kinase CheA
MSELVKLNLSEYGLEENKAGEIKKLYLPMIEQLENFEERFNEIVSKEVTKEIIPDAKRLRLDISKVRTAADKARKEAKAEYLRAGNAIQGAYNTLAYAVQSKEEKLKDIEDYFEKLERERIEALQIERSIELEKYEIEVIPQNLGEMSQEVWDNYIFGTKTSFEQRKEAERKAEEQRIEAEKKAEQERIEKEKARIKEEKRIKAENERLQKEAELKEKRNTELRPYIVFIRDYDKLLNMSEVDYKKEFSDIKKGAEDHWEYERKEQIRKAKEEEAEREKQRKERAEYEAKLKAEREAKEKIEREEKAKREKLEAELKAKKEAEREAKEKEEKRLQAELSKGDSAKVEDLISDLQNLKTKYSFKSDKNKKMYSDVTQLIDKVINHINN